MGRRGVASEAVLQSGEVEHLKRALEALDAKNRPFLEQRARIVEALLAAGVSIDVLNPLPFGPRPVKVASARSAIHAEARGQRGSFTSRQIWASMTAQNMNAFDPPLSVARVSRALNELREAGELRIISRRGDRGEILYERLNNSAVTAT